MDPSGYEPESYLDIEILNALIGVGDGISGGILPRLRGEDDPVDQSSIGHQIGEVTGEIVGGLICGAVVARVGAGLSTTKYGSFLNQNRYLRVGLGDVKINGTLVKNTPRLSIGPNYKGLPKWWQDLRHIDLRLPFVD